MQSLALHFPFSGKPEDGRKNNCVRNSFQPVGERAYLQSYRSGKGIALHHWMRELLSTSNEPVLNQTFTLVTRGRAELDSNREIVNCSMVPGA